MIADDLTAFNDLGKAGADPDFMKDVKDLHARDLVEWHYSDGGGFFLSEKDNRRNVLVATYDYGADFEVTTAFWDFIIDNKQE
jgi:hypothetical protein